MLDRPPSIDSAVPLSRVELHLVPIAALGLQASSVAAGPANTVLVTAVSTVRTTIASQQRQDLWGTGCVTQTDNRQEVSTTAMPKKRLSRYEELEQARKGRTVG